MWKRIGALTFIFLCTSAAWIMLGEVTGTRTHKQDENLKRAVGRLWGTVQMQRAPQVYCQTGAEPETGEAEKHPITLAGSEIRINLILEHRKKGLLWYSTYRVEFSGKYLVANPEEVEREIFFEYEFPTAEGIYDNFSLVVDGRKIEELQPVSGKIVKKLTFAPGKEKSIEISYGSQGMDAWWYVFGSNVSQIRNFRLVMATNFDDIDFPANGISPTKKKRTSSGWELTWEYSNLISGIQIGMDLPRKLNPGPFVTRVSFFAPVSLFLFLFLMFLVTTVRRTNIHPMNYFFISASFFSFHLLMAYLVDHIDIHAAFVICSIVSICLVISYMRLVVGIRFALVETGISQFVYLVLFAYSFFLEGYTGLAIAIACILTLFVVMQLTGRIDWEKLLANGKKQ
jgi:hypothetical protein